MPAYFRLSATLPSPPSPQKRKRDRQETWSDKMFIKVLIVMIILQLYRAYAPLDFFAQPGPLAVGYVLSDPHYNTPELRDECALHECALLNRELVGTRRGGVGGVEAQRLFHKMSSLAIERLNGLFKNILRVARSDASQRVKQMPVARLDGDLALSDRHDLLMPATATCWHRH